MGDPGADKIATAVGIEFDGVAGAEGTQLLVFRRGDTAAEGGTDERTASGAVVLRWSIIRRTTPPPWDCLRGLIIRRASSSVLGEAIAVAVTSGALCVANRAETSRGGRVGVMMPDGEAAAARGVVGVAGRCEEVEGRGWEASRAEGESDSEWAVATPRWRREGETRGMASLARRAGWGL